MQLHHKIGKQIPGNGLIQSWCSLAKYNLSNSQEIRLRGAHMMMQPGSLTTQIHDLAKKLDSPFAEPSASLNSIGYTNLCKEYQIARSPTDRQGIQNSREYCVSSPPRCLAIQDMNNSVCHEVEQSTFGSLYSPATDGIKLLIKLHMGSLIPLLG